MKSLRWIGIVLMVIGIAGFFTVADDLRHTGELMGVGTVLTLGLIALAVSSWRQIGKRGEDGSCEDTCRRERSHR